MNQDSIFKKYETPLKGGVLLPYLIKVKGHQCEKCKNSIWLEQPITLQVHHKDGDRTNNLIENLELLCPNCHSLTDNFGSKNKKFLIKEEDFVNALKNNKSIRQALFSLGLSDASGNYTRAYALIEKYGISIPHTTIKYCKCGKRIDKKSSLCSSCYALERRVSERPSREELKNLIRTTSFTEIGRIYNVSDNAIRKWCILENLPKTKKEIKSYSDEDWNKV